MRLEPIPTDLSPRLTKLHGIQAVLIDIYGTLVISSSGEVGTVDQNDRNQRSGENERDGQLLRQEIERLNSLRISPTNPRPEIEILDVWRSVLDKTGRQPLGDQPSAVAEIAAAHEARTNPTWPMPGGKEVLSKLHDAKFRLGIVSNAQFYTIPLVERVIGGALADRFELDFCYFSNRYRSSKPGTLMFDRLVAAMRRRGIEPEQAIYVGNDMLNDIYAAHCAGMKTALFAADTRSLRLREDHAACADLSADVLLTHWDQLLQCLV